MIAQSGKSFWKILAVNRVRWGNGTTNLTRSAAHVPWERKRHTKELRVVIAVQPERSRLARAQTGAPTALPVLIERHLLAILVRTPPRVPHVLPDIIRVTPGRPCVWVVCQDSIKGRIMLFNVTIVR